MKLLIVGISDCLVTGDVSAVIATYGLGSCIALAVHDRVARVGGLLHFMLPDSALDAGRAERNPFAFADSGIPVLLEAAYAMGAQKRRLYAWAAGGAQVIADGGMFSVGTKNRAAMHHALAKQGIGLATETLGGNSSRNVYLDIAAGSFSVLEFSGRGAFSPSRPGTRTWTSERP
jgi:chemotaxis protein CheD